MPSKKSEKTRSTFKEYSGQEKKYYEALILARELVAGSLRNHAADALDCSNADKRGVTTHMADLGSDNSRHEMELQLMTADGDVLKLIDDALERLSKGSYGRCQDCGEMISEKRLEARPYAVYCIKCKSLREQNNDFPSYSRR